MEHTNQTLEIEELADNYIATWNETDAGQRHELLTRLWAQGGNYHDPLMKGAGVEQISQLIGGAQQQFAGLRFKRAGTAEQVGDHVRFSWHLAPAGEEVQPIAGGTDFCLVDETGRLQSVIGFLDFMPAQGK